MRCTTAATAAAAAAVCAVRVEMSDNNSVHYLDWLPPRFPSTVRCIVSSRDSHLPCLARLEHRQVFMYHLHQMNDESVTNMIQHYLATYNKVSPLFNHHLPEIRVIHCV